MQKQEVYMSSHPIIQNPCTQLCFRICNWGGEEDIRRVIRNIYYAASKVPVQYMNIPRAKRLNIHTVVLIKDYY